MIRLFGITFGKKFVATYVNKKGITYFLHSKKVILRNSKVHQIIYWFATKRDPKTAQEKFPFGYGVIESSKTGLPFLRYG